MAGQLVGARLRARRQALGLKQAEVARQAGISASYLNLIEHNRRGIGGKLLIDIAGVLGLAVSDLLESTDSDLIRAIQAAAAAASDPELAAELEQSDAFVGRYPGWARLIARLAAERTQLEALVDSLSDRLAHDPFLSESLHEILSSVTAIHATADILTGADMMEGLQQRRFQANIFDESARLSDLARGLVSHFDRQAEARPPGTTPLDEVEAFLVASDYHFPALEGGDDSALEALMESAPGIGSESARQLAAALLKGHAADCRALPGAEFEAAAAAADYDPRALARSFGVPLPTVFRRLAFRPPGAPAPAFGLITCDGTGAVLLRKPLPGFALPRYGSACPLWPLYQAMSRPHAPLRALLRTPDGQLFRAHAFSAYLEDAPVPVLHTHMLFSARGQGPAGGETPGAEAPEIAVGPSCRICPRPRCPARREPSILGEEGAPGDRALAKAPVTGP